MRRLPALHLLEGPEVLGRELLAVLVAEALAQPSSRVVSSTQEDSSIAAPTMWPRSSVRTGSSIVFQVMNSQFSGCGRPPGRSRRVQRTSRLP